MNDTVSPVFPRSSHVRLLLCLALVAVALPGCRRKEASEPPVATPSFSVGRERVAIGSPVKLTYRFEVAPNAKVDDDYLVFMHVLDPGGEQLWTDDHLPPTPTSTWKPGQVVEYSRTVFVPNYPYIGEAVVRLGLYSQKDGHRLTLAGKDVSRREYEVGRFQLLPQSENIFLIYKEGWHPAEVAADNPASEWQWTAKRATISFRNPTKDSTFYIEYDARIDQFSPPQQVTLRVGDQVFGTFAAGSKEKQLLTFPLTAAQLGTGDMAEIAIEVDRTFTPGGGDTRELGLRVYHTFVEPK
jgi:hypothetical protein